MTISYTRFHHWPTDATGAALRDLHALVFANPDVSEAELRERLAEQRDPLVQLAWYHFDAAHDGAYSPDGTQQLVGYKIGYQRKQTHYYSWIGGVDPAFRRHGIANTLMREQHQWCLDQGYRSIRTHTKNSWRGMLILNIRHDFDIIGTLTDEYGEPKLILEKRFVAPT